MTKGTARTLLAYVLPSPSPLAPNSPPLPFPPHKKSTPFHRSYHNADKTSFACLQRGGAGNINSLHVKPTNPPGRTGDTDVVPETAMKGPGTGAGYENFHVGRGGEGNVYREQPKSKADGLKEKILHPHGEAKKE